MFSVFLSSYINMIESFYFLINLHCSVMGEHLINELSCVVASRKHKETKDGWHIFIMPSPQGMLGPTITMHDVTSYDNKDSSN